MTRHDSVCCSVLIVNFNGGDMVKACVRAAMASSVPVEVLVWDNASSDGSPDALTAEFDRKPGFGLFRHSENIGFAAGVNRLLQNASGDILLLLNPDCLLEKDTIATVRQVLETDPDAGMAGCLLRNSDGSEQAGCRRQVPTPWRSLVRVFHLNKICGGHPWFQSISLNTTPLPEQPVAVEAISGAFMLVTRKALEDVGPLDDQYFMHCEDLDWCMRFRKNGWRILFDPRAEVMHHQGYCSASRPVVVELYKHRGMLRFYRKFFRHQYPGVLMWLVTATVWIRFFLVAAGHWAGGQRRRSGHG
jgi:GT2 family glycosyltransferase